MSSRGIEEKAVKQRAQVEWLYEDIQERLVRHRAMVMQYMDEAAEMSRPGRPNDQNDLLAALHETIEVLEETKSSFKSKRLGLLREKLEQVIKK